METGGERTAHVIPALPIRILRIFLFISFPSANHTSVKLIDQVVHGLSIFYLLEQKI